MAIAKIGTGTESDRCSIALATRTGQRIDNVQVVRWDDSIMRTKTRIHQRTFPNIVLRSADSVYNCGGMVFASRRTAIDIEDVPWILKEDGYRPIRPKDVCVGDVVLYRDHKNEPSHVGRVAILPSQDPREISVPRILSQWGEDGEYLHAPGDVPLMYGQPKEYWTDRRRLP